MEWITFMKPHRCFSAVFGKLPLYSFQWIACVPAFQEEIDKGCGIFVNIIGNLKSQLKTQKTSIARHLPVKDIGYIGHKDDLLKRLVLTDQRLPINKRMTVFILLLMMDTTVNYINNKWS